MRSVHRRACLVGAGQILIRGGARDAVAQSGHQTAFAAAVGDAGCVVLVCQQRFVGSEQSAGAVRVAGSAGMK